MVVRRFLILPTVRIVLLFVVSFWSGAQGLSAEVFESQKISTDVAGSFLGRTLAARGRRATVSLDDGVAVRYFYRFEDNRWSPTSSGILSYPGPVPDDLSMDASKVVRIVLSGIHVIQWPESASAPNSYHWENGFPYDIEAIAVYGNRIVVGRPHTGVGGLAQVYAMTIEGDWVLEENFSGYGSAGENVGAAVALDGNLLAVGAPRTDGGLNGIVFVYERSGGQWNFVDCVWSPDPDNNNGFGSAVAVSGDLVVIGSPRQDRSTPPNALNAGAVYGYERQGTAEGIVTLELQFQLFGEGLSDHFGSSVDLTDTALVVGVPGYDEPGDPCPLSDAGEVHVYRRVGAQVQHAARLHASDPEVFGGLGTSVALSASDVLAGAPRADGPGGETDAGAVYIWYGLGSLFYDGFESGNTSAWSISMP